MSDLQEYTNKANEAIASLDYTDCGYKMLTVVQESNKDCNYVIEAKWKNEETYKIIYESDAYKKVTEPFSDSIRKFFKGQIYVRAQE